MCTYGSTSSLPGGVAPDLGITTPKPTAEAEQSNKISICALCQLVWFLDLSLVACLGGVQQMIVFCRLYVDLGVDYWVDQLSQRMAGVM